MHPNGSANIIKEGALAGRGGLGNIVGNPLETTVFLSRLIFDGTFDKFPALRVVRRARRRLSCRRTSDARKSRASGRTRTASSRRSRATTCGQNILADTMVFSEEGLRHLVAEMGVGQVVFGTDIPFNWPVNVDLIVINARR